jgi:hypothetical protein
MALGRPSSYTDEKAQRICELMALGRSLKSICEDDDQPDYKTVMRWLDSNESFRQKYAHAREKQGAYLAAEIVEIADAASNEEYQRARLRVDARKWYASKLAPKVYGERVSTELSGPGGGPVQVDAAGTLAALELLLLERAAKEGKA